MKNLPLNALRAFSIVYETGGIRPASRVLGIAHSSVARHVQELQDWLGVDLILTDRTSRSLAFTPQGEALGKAGLNSLRQLGAAVSAVREKRRGNAVTVTTTPSFAARWLLPRLDGFNSRFPWIEMSVLADQRLMGPADHGADIGIRMGAGPWAGLQCTRWMDDTLFPVMSPASWEKSGRPTRLSDLTRLTLLHDRDPNTSWDRWCGAHGMRGFDTLAGPRFASSDLVLRAAAQGLGVALARGRLAADDLARGLLIRPFGEHCLGLQDAYWLIREPGGPQRLAVGHAVEWLLDQAKDA